MLPGNFGMPFMLPSTPFVKMDMEAPNFNTLSPITSLQNSMAKPVQKRQYSSTSKNFCDLCKKEVCNKYFLRTHMLKMHNIVIDENKTVIANIDTQEKEKEGSVTFRCDVCLLDMKSRNELREHKKEVHGIQPLITPTSASAQFSRASSTASKPSSAANSAIGSGSTQGSLTAFEFPSMSSADSPPSTATGNDLKCSKCDAEYANVETLVEHFRDEHPDM
uniref:C2H2-type domain-containing protein n=1 Tax=Panagrolaimus sp. JU765 TaxID=591449 RepID=A0AC34QB15_9BILA